MINTKFDPQTIFDISDIEIRQSLLIDTFNKALSEKDYDTARQIAETAIGDERLNDKCPAHLQLSLWKWLHTELIYRYNQTEENSEEENKAFQDILELLWRAKWLIIESAKDADTLKEHILEFNQEILSYNEELNISPASLYKALTEQSILLGDTETSKKYFQQWQSIENDNFADCEACQQDSLVCYYHAIGDYAKAAELAAPILNDIMACDAVPYVTYYPAIESLIQLGKLDEAKKYLKKAEQNINKEIDKFAHLFASLITLYIRLGEEKTACEIFVKYYDSLEKNAYLNSFNFLQFLIAMASLHNETALEDAKTLAQVFDQRNGNQHYQSQIELLLSKPENIH